MKVDVWFLLRSRQAKKIKVTEYRKEIDFRKGIYLTDPKAINFYKTGDKPKGVESFFFEGNPSPLKINKADTDTSIDFLNTYIYENFVEQTGDMPKERGKNAISWIRENVTIASVFKWLVIGLIVFSIVRGFAVEYLGPF